MEKKDYHRVTFTLDGKRYERYGKTLKEAHAKAAELKEKLKRGEVGVSSKMTVARWAKEWLETYKLHSVGAKTYEDYKRKIENLIIPEIGNLPIKDVKDVQLQKILNQRAGKSKSDVDKTRIVIKSLFRRAYLSRLITRDPAEAIEAPAAKEGTHRSITDHEREHILKLAETHPAGLWVQMMLYCGLRSGECRALDWRHIDLEKRIVHVVCAMKAGTEEIGPPKSAAGVRDIPIPDVFLEALQKAQRGPFEPVFVKPISKKRHTKKSMESQWRNFKRNLDIQMGAKLYRNKITINAVADDLEPYCLRHTYCTDLQDKGVPINVARYLMGHSNILVTSKIYTHTTEKALESARDKINGSVAIDVVKNKKLS